MNISALILMSIEAIVGMGIHIQKIKTVKICKPITWELEIYSSVICIIFSTLHTILDMIEYTCPILNDFSEFIIQVAAPIFKIFGVNIILFHSFAVGVYKYYIILIKRPMTFDNKAMDRKWLIFLILFPVLWTCLNLFRSTQIISSKLSTASNCKSFGFYDQITFFCDFKDDGYYHDSWSFIYITTQLYCVVHSMINIFFKFNIFEALLYFQIFRFMRR